MITIKQASDTLRVTEANLSMSNKYNKYYHKRGKGKGSCLFDIDGYNKNAMKEETFVCQIQLLVEYLNKILEINYSYLAKISGTTRQYMSHLKISRVIGTRLYDKIKSMHPEWYKSFKEYYDMDIQPI